EQGPGAVLKAMSLEPWLQDPVLHEHEVGAAAGGDAGERGFEALVVGGDKNRGARRVVEDVPARVAGDEADGHRAAGGQGAGDAAGAEDREARRRGHSAPKVRAVRRAVERRRGRGPAASARRAAGARAISWA